MTASDAEKLAQAVSAFGRDPTATLSNPAIMGEDPTQWDAPWGGEYEFATLGGRVKEYACHEGNYAMTGILAGAGGGGREGRRGGGGAR